MPSAFGVQSHPPCAILFYPLPAKVNPLGCATNSVPILQIRQKENNNPPNQCNRRAHNQHPQNQNKHKRSNHNQRQQNADRQNALTYRFPSFAVCHVSVCCRCCKHNAKKPPSQGGVRFGLPYLAQGINQAPIVGFPSIPSLTNVKSHFSVQLSKPLSHNSSTSGIVSSTFSVLMGCTMPEQNLLEFAIPGPFT